MGSMPSSTPGPARTAPRATRLALPTPFAVGRVNAYLLEGEPLTLVDCGAQTADAYVMLLDELAARGRSVDAIELVVVTHGHVDHGGLAAVLRDRHGARVACLAGLASTLEAWEDSSEREDTYAAELMARHGVPGEVVAAVHAASGTVRKLGADVVVDERLEVGQLLTAGSRELRVHHRPGHSQWDTVLVDEAAREALVGDHVLLRTSSNANMQCPTDPGSLRLRPLLDMRRSLLATRALGLDVLLPGHGPAITDPRAVIDRRLEQQRTRAAELLQLLRTHGPADACTLARHLLGERAITQAFLAISEVVGHLDLLLEDGRAVEHVGPTCSCFEASPVG